MSEFCIGHPQVNFHHNDTPQKKIFFLLWWHPRRPNDACTLRVYLLPASKPSPVLCCMFPQQADCSMYPNMTNEEGKMTLLCNKMFSPVCGTDGVTYDNECMLCAHNVWVLWVRAAWGGNHEAGMGFLSRPLLCPVNSTWDHWVPSCVWEGNPGQVPWGVAEGSLPWRPALSVLRGRGASRAGVSGTVSSWSWTSPVPVADQHCWDMECGTAGCRQSSLTSIFFFLESKGPASARSMMANVRRKLLQ